MSVLECGEAHITIAGFSLKSLMWKIYDAMDGCSKRYTEGCQRNNFLIINNLIISVCISKRLDHKIQSQKEKSKKKWSKAEPD